MKINAKINKQSVLTYFISFFVIMSGAVIYNYINNSKVSPSLWKYLLMLCYVLSILSYKKISIKTIKETAILVAYILVYAIASFFFSSPMFNSLITFVLGFVLAFLYVRELIRHNDFKLLLDAFANIMLVITVISLFFWLLGSQLKMIPYTTIGYDYGRGTIAHNFYWLYFDEPIQYTNFFGFSLIRNCGICAEAPGFANYLMYGLAIELVKKESKPWRVIVFILGLITNFSSKSYMLLAVALLFMLYKAVMIDGRFKHKKVICTIIAPIILVIFVGALYGIVIDKSINSVSSFNGRVNSLQNAIDAWLAHPLLGAGIANYDAIQSGSMGITLLLAQCGISVMLIYIFAAVCTLKTNVLAEYKWGVYLFISLFVVNFFISNVGTSTLTVLTITAGLAVYHVYGKKKKVHTIKT